MRYSPIALHLPDGFLSPLVAALGWGAAAILLWRALRETGQDLGPRQVPRMGVLAAFLFAAQAINFPIAGGTSGHLVGSTLAAVLVGPWAASVVMSSVIVLQGFLFQDGGLLAMGWNLINMGMLAAFVGRAVYDGIRRVLGDRPASRFAGAFVGAWLSVIAGAAATAAELAASGTFPLRLALPAMVGVHAVIGLGEAAITLATLAFLTAARPALVGAGLAASQTRGANLTLLGLLAALALALIAPWASPSPDGLERVLEGGGLAGWRWEPPWALLPGYAVPFVEDPVLTTMLAVAIGTLLVFGIGLLLGRLAVADEG